MKYFLDANIISYLADIDSPFHEAIFKRFLDLSDKDEVSMSILVLYELHYSMSHAEGKEMKPGIIQTKTDLCDSLSVLSLTENGAKIFGNIKTKYQKEYNLPKTALRRDTIDLMIASSAIAEGYTLVSNDKIFKTLQLLVPEFQTENWAA